MKIESCYVQPPYITLQNLLKFAGICETGGQAKEVILNGMVSVNNEICLSRGKKLYAHDIVSLNDQQIEVLFYEDPNAGN